jgi:ABC-type lipoprotein release transport system permease subunit
MVMNAAVLLDEPERLHEAQSRIESATKAQGLATRVVTWQTASGLTGQFVLLMRFVLYAAVLIIFAVALVILSNALVMATLERVREFGTLRALGAQRNFVLAILIAEGGLVGLIFGAAGAALGATLVIELGRTGIPAHNDVMTFFFSGSLLQPALNVSNVLMGVLTATLVSVLSCLYPAWIAVRVTPRLAMQSEE